ncbi:unnamed protein product [Didymodactylos carnosus]|uniref:Acyl-coenzyme A thioesterase 13 n=1 Tax=Didymodactylos carnosus TaxID=1234261 RepID=A0A814IMY2_9BILA|nr:unnamed protein product [Didymodactylos carnosus]CAF1057987.1 unnamed protein product [Didymodactylos carnosus]CAF3796907.1 unnamed protein product [Didymodactylos carnosus]CAF3823931.1 unnamed protein product [Didymodactylos carnosus]
MTSSSVVKTLQEILNVQIKSQKFSRIFDGIRVIAAEKPGRVQCEIDIEEKHLNRGNTMHGGMVTSLVDTVSTLALESTKNHPIGVSVDLSVSFLKAAKPGETIIIDAETIKLGKTLAFLNVELRNKKTNELIATGKHTKFLS